MTRGAFGSQSTWRALWSWMAAWGRSFAPVDGRCLQQVLVLVLKWAPGQDDWLTWLDFQHSSRGSVLRFTSWYPCFGLYSFVDVWFTKQASSGMKAYNALWFEDRREPRRAEVTWPEARSPWEPLAHCPGADINRKHRPNPRPFILQGKCLSSR